MGESNARMMRGVGGSQDYLHDHDRRYTTQPYTSGATRAAHRLAEKLAADLKRLGPLRDTLGRQQVRREQRKAAKKGAKR